GLGIFRGPHVLADIINPLRGERVGAQIRILVAPREQFFLLQDLEELQQPACGLVGSIEIGEGSLIGRGLLGDRERKERALGHALAREDSGGRGWPLPAAAAAAPATIATMPWIVAFRSASSLRARCPPAMWPVSCAMMPIIWLGLSLRIRVPLFMNRFWPPATKEFSCGSLTM